MPAIKTTAPPVGTYSFVCKLQKRLAPNNSQYFTSYAETANSCGLLLDGEVEHLIFLRSVHSMNAATRRGWANVTDRWFAQLAREGKAGVSSNRMDPVEVKPITKEKEAPESPVLDSKPEDTPTPVAPVISRVEQSVYAAMIGKKAMKKQEICDLTGLVKADFREVMLALVAAGLVDRKGSGPTTVYKAV